MGREILIPESLARILEGRFDFFRQDGYGEPQNWGEKGYSLLLKATEILRTKGNQVGLVVSTDFAEARVDQRTIRTRVVRNLRGLQGRYHGDPDAVSVTAKLATGRRKWEEIELFMILGSGSVVNWQGESATLEQIEMLAEILSFIDQRLPDREALFLKLIDKQKKVVIKNNNFSLEALRGLTGDPYATKDEFPWNKPVGDRDKKVLKEVGDLAIRIHEILP